MAKRSTGIVADEKGVTITEFGLIAPAVAAMLLGTMDLGHSLYMRTVLDGAIQDVARDSSLEDGVILGRQQAIDYRIREQIKRLNSNLTDNDIVITRRYYRNFTNAYNAEEEDYTDTNNDGTCNASEPYVDANLNGVWDSDGGDQGQGGAKDVSIVSVKVSYNRLFPMAKLAGMPERITLSANTVLANQPYGEQAQYGAAQTRNCDD
jgi:Flp pilus assembly pilin Flp